MHLYRNTAARVVYTGDPECVPYYSEIKNGQTLLIVTTFSLSLVSTFLSFWYVKLYGEVLLVLLLLTTTVFVLYRGRYGVSHDIFVQVDWFRTRPSRRSHLSLQTVAGTSCVVDFYNTSRREYLVGYQFKPYGSIIVFYRYYLDLIVLKT